MVLALIVPHLSCAEGTSGYKVGVKTGFTALDHDERFKLYEIYGISGLPWDKHWSSGWGMETGLNMNAGILEAADDKGFVGSVGPIFTFKKQDCRFLLTFAFRLALMDDHEYGDEDLGGAFAFIEELGIRYPLGWNFDAGYHFRHMSNAGIYDTNPGVDLHVFELVYNF